MDLRWQAAAGLHTGAEGFHPTVLVGQRNRLRASQRPRRLFEDTKVVARSAGALKDRARGPGLHPPARIGGHAGHRDPAVGRHPQTVAGARPPGPGPAEQVHSALQRDDDYAGVGKPPCPAGNSVTIVALRRGGGRASFAPHCTPEGIERYRADRPIVERKMAHFARRLWEGARPDVEG